VNMCRERPSRVRVGVTPRRQNYILFSLLITSLAMVLACGILASIRLGLPDSTYG
jgi:hypothetical protein